MDEEDGALIMKKLSAFAIAVLSVFVLVGFLIFFFFPQLFSMLISANELPCKYPLPQEYQGDCFERPYPSNLDLSDCACSKMRAAVFFIDICLLVFAILAAAIVFLGPKIMKLIKNK